MSPRRRPASGSTDSLIITDRDNGVRRFWAAYIGSRVSPNGDVDGFSSFESRMTDLARKQVWEAAEAFAAWAVNQPHDVSDALRVRVDAAKYSVQSIATDREPQQESRPPIREAADAGDLANEELWHS